MRFKDTIRLAKEALKHPKMYSEEEILYMQKALDSAKRSLKAKKLKRKEEKGFGYDSKAD